MTKKRILWLSSIIAIILLAVGCVGYERVSAQPSGITIQTTATATTTMSFMTPGTATTTYQFDSGNFSDRKELNNAATDRVSLYVQFAASSSVSTLVITPQFSNNGIDWYGYNSPALTPPANTSGYTPLASTTIAYYYTPGVAGTTTQVFLLPDVPSQHERVVFSVPIGTANGAVYAEVDLKKNPSNP